MEELKCPFCGGEAWQEVNSKKAWTRCAQCGATTAGFQDFHNTDGSIIDRRVMAAGAWNRRSAPENKALTVDELRKMDGEPVYLVYPSDPSASHWEIIYLVMQQHGAGGEPIGNEWVRMTSGASERAADYGKTWLAYARRPEAPK